MKYVFNKLDTPNISDIKKQMQKVFEKNSDEIFDAMHPELKKSLGIDDLIDGKSKFDELAANINSELYKFIEIK